MPSINSSLATSLAVPSVPILSAAVFRKAHTDEAVLPSLLDGMPSRLVTSGRIAIGLALRAAGIGAGDIVLVPAYHSMSMIPPVHWCGADVVFYRVHPDTAIDLDDIRMKLDGRVKAIMATHFFGIPQDLTRLRALCDQHHVALIEDCAHCFFGERDGIPIGRTGDYAIGSSMKFFPIYEGGCLISHRHALPVPLRSAGIGFEAKAALAALENGFAHGRMTPLRLALSLPLHAKTVLWNLCKRRSRRAGSDNADATDLAPSSSDSSFSFDARWVDKRSSWFSQWVMQHASRTRIVTRRRRHYQVLQQALEGLPGWRPLFSELPAGACPWVFPILVERAEALFDVLHAARVPMVRFGAVLWPGVDEGTCANSVELGRRLIAFPCHQELDAAELSRMIAAIRAALEATATVTA